MSKRCALLLLSLLACTGNDDVRIDDSRPPTEPSADVAGTTPPTATAPPPPTTMPPPPGSTTPPSVVTTRIGYGASVKGRELAAYQITPSQPNGKTALLTFGVHGFEDAFDHDGRALFAIATKLVEHYDATPASLAGFTVWIVPSANPDGMIDGTNNLREGSGSPYGRCTSEGQDLNRQFSTSHFDEHDALKALFDRAKPSVVVDFHGWYDCTYGATSVGHFFADAFNESYAGKPSHYCYTRTNGTMDCGAQLGGTFHLNDAITDDLFAAWANDVRGVPAALVEYPAPDFDTDGSYDTVPDAALGYPRMRDDTVALLTGRTIVALDRLFASF